MTVLPGGAILHHPYKEIDHTGRTRPAETSIFDSTPPVGATADLPQSDSGMNSIF